MGERWSIQCRSHGGYFYVEPRRGRPPIKCNEDNPCDAQGVLSGAAMAKADRIRQSKNAGSKPKQATAVIDRSERMQPADIADRHQVSLKKAVGTRMERTREADPQEQPTRRSRKPQEASGVNGGREASVKEAQRVRELLEAQDWQVSGKVASTDDTVFVTASRGEELLIITIRDGKATDQYYSLWNAAKPSSNGAPLSKLPFDPGEVPDSELAQLLTGAKVTWWNKLGSKEESGYCGKESITITHQWTGTGEEVPGARIINFIDPDNGGYRSFRLDALLKVGR